MAARSVAGAGAEWGARGDATEVAWFAGGVWLDGDGVGMGLFLGAPAPNPARALVMRFPARGFGAAAAAAGFGAVETKSDEVTVAEAATDAATDATTPGLSVNYYHFR